jgi:hypothetical protein
VIAALVALLILTLAPAALALGCLALAWWAYARWGKRFVNGRPYP